MIGPWGGILLFLWALRDAAREGNLVKVMDLVQDGANVHDNQHTYGYSPLHEAARQGHLSVVKYLVEDTELSVHSVDNYENSTPLHEACKGGHLEVLKYLVESAKANMYHLDSDQRTALHKACVAGHLDIARYLVQRDNTQRRLVDGRDKHDLTPLHDACQNGHLAIVQFLIREARARVHDQGVSGDTPLHLACLHAHVDVCRFLLKDLVPHVRLDIRNKDGKTPFEMVQQSRSPRRLEMLYFLDEWNGVAVAPRPPPAPKMANPEPVPNQAAETFDYKPEDTMVAQTKPDMFHEIAPALDNPAPSSDRVDTHRKVRPPSVETTSVAQTVVAASPPMVRTGDAMPVKARLVRLEEQFQMKSSGGTVVERIAVLEESLFGKANQGTISSRLSLLEEESVDWTRILRLEKALDINANSDASVFERIMAMEIELFGIVQGGTLASRLSLLENEVVDFSRITRLEEELDITAGPLSSSSSAPMARIAALELALFGETQEGTIANRLTLLEKQLVG